MNWSEKITTHRWHLLGLGIIFFCAILAGLLAREDATSTLDVPPHRDAPPAASQESEQAVLAYYARNHGGDTSVSLRLVQDDCCACTYEVLKEGRAVSRIMYMEGKFQEMR